jgi:SAM-dependent methyltransferase
MTTLSIPRSLPVMGRSPGRRPPDGERLHVTRADLGAALAAAGPETSLPAIVWSHATTALRLATCGIRYLQHGSAASDAYRRMTTAEFHLINGRQAWANWRTITYNLSGNLPIDRPLTVLDLCSGTGDSTQVLAWWLPAGSRIIAVELDPRFAAAASKRDYHNRHGDPIAVDVRCASVLETFADADGRPLDAGSVDVVHAIGSIGCHFKAAESAAIIAECARVLRHDGFAMLDTGSRGTSAEELQRLADGVGLQVTGQQRSWWLDRYRQLILRKAERLAA